MTAPTSPHVPCPSCGAATSGKYCSDCGAPVRGALCAACRTILTPGSRFCHRCGLAVGAQAVAVAPAAPDTFPPPQPQAPSQGGNQFLPWSIAALALVAVVAILAGQRFGSSDQASAPQGDGQTPLGETPGVVRAPDISSLSPRERADRLYDRMMRLASENKKDSVQFFAPMALSAYASLGPLDLDLRYDFGRIAEISDNLPIAQAQADSILAANPTHLLGLILAGRVAALQGNAALSNSLSRRLLQAEPTESKKALDEYTRHRGDIDVALSEARARK